MQVRFKKKEDVFNILVTVLAAVVSVGMMLFGVWKLGLENTWPELVLNPFYIACLVMMWMYFFSWGITTKQFNYWCSVCVGITVLLRDILFAPQLENYALHLICLTLSVTLLVLLTYFYARKDWKSYSKGNLWLIFIIDMILAIVYNIVIFTGPGDEYSTYLMVEIWIRPTITYGLVACYVKGAKEE